MDIRGHEVYRIECPGENRQSQPMQSQGQAAKSFFQCGIHWHQHDSARRDIGLKFSKENFCCPGRKRLIRFLARKNTENSHRANTEVVAGPVAAKCERNCAESISATYSLTNVEVSQ
jgi:hypothetical protein